MDGEPSVSKKERIACGQEIAARAILCAECGSSQIRWRNELRYWGTVSTVVAVGITALGFLTSILPEVRKALFWRDRVEIAYFDSQDVLVVTNQGDGPVFVSGGIFQMDKDPPWRRHDVDINAVVQPGAFHVTPAKSQGTLVRSLKRGEGMTTVRGLSEKEFIAEVDVAMEDKHCYALTFHDPASIRRHLLMAGKTLNVLPTASIVIYRPSRGRRFVEKPVEAGVLLHRVAREGCRAKYGKDWMFRGSDRS